jgi:predicted dehydrogenase
MTKLRVGFIGLGMVAQVVHLPVLRAMAREFEIVALCDISQELGSRVGAAFPDAVVYQDHRTMLAAGGLDVVAVVNSDEYHADCAIDALEAGCHVLIEKPVCLTLAELERIKAARDKAGKVAMVGYMRRFAGAYRSMAERLGPSPQLRHVSVRDIIGPNDYFLRQTESVIVPGDVTLAQRDERAERARLQVREALGDVTPDRVTAYRMLCGLGSHDLSALRGLIGAPRGVIGAGLRQNGLFVAAILDQGDFMATFEMGVDKVGRFDAYIEAFTGQERVRVDYDTPFIRHLPTLMSVARTEGDRLNVEIERPSYRDPYTNQWQALHDSVVGSAPVVTTLEDSSHDLLLFQQMIGAMPG